MRLAHLSDVHLLSLDGTKVRDFLNKRITGSVNILFHRSKHYSVKVFDALVDDINREGHEQVLCTGDITNLALESEFRFARTRFDRFRIGPENVSCIPGNHDMYIAEAEGLFEKTFAEFCASDPGWPAGWPLVRVRGDALIVGLSTSMPSGWFMAYGEIGGQQLEVLEAALADPRHKHLFRVIMLHHPATGKYAESKRRGLRDRKAFAEVVARHGAELVIHGHEHKDLKEVLFGPGGLEIPVRGIQAGTYSVNHAALRARYRVYEIERRGVAERPVLIDEELRTWQPDEKQFVYEHPPGAASPEAPLP